MLDIDNTNANAFNQFKSQPQDLNPIRYKDLSFISTLKQDNNSGDSNAHKCKTKINNIKTFAENNGLKCVAIPFNTKGMRSGKTNNTITDQECNFTFNKCKFPHNVGLITGKNGNLTVLDIDIYQNNENISNIFWKDLKSKFPEIQETRAIYTASGGLHYYFQYEPMLISSALYLNGQELDIELLNGNNVSMTVPSRCLMKKYKHLYPKKNYESDLKPEHTGRYKWLNNKNVNKMSNELVEFLLKHIKNKTICISRPISVKNNGNCSGSYWFSDKQKAVIDKYVKVSSPSIYEHGYAINIESECPFNKHDGTNHRFLLVFPDEIQLKCHSKKCSDNINVVWKFIPVGECFVESEDEDDDVVDDDNFQETKFFALEHTDSHSEQEINQIQEIEAKIHASENKLSVLENEDIDTSKPTAERQKQGRRLKKDINNQKNNIKELNQQLKSIKQQQKQTADLKIFKLRQKYFEKFHAKIKAPFYYIEKRRNVITFYKRKAFEDLYSHLGTFAISWFEQRDILTYDKMDFMPPPLKCPKYVYNSFTGIAIDKLKQKKFKKASFDVILNHIKIMVNHDKKGYEYMLDYLAHMFQKLGELPRVSLLFKSEQGSGKNIFWEELIGNRMLGDEFWFQTAQMDKVVGRFNMLNRMFLVLLDETQGKDSFSNNDKIKNIITSPKIAWEQKSVQGIVIRNCGRYIMLTNNETPIKIEMSDRRFVVFEMSNEKQNNREYFKNFMKAVNDDNVVMSFHQFLMDRNIEDWDSINDRPITDLYKELKSVNIPIYVRFLIDWVIKNDKDATITARDFYEKFRIYLFNNGHEDKNITSASFGRFIKKYDGVSCKRTSKCMEYTLIHQKIEKYLTDKDFMENTDIEII